MGTDIHWQWQKKTTEGWENIPEPIPSDRHYFLFAWLADVRNGYGFAGVVTHTPIIPISKPRGLPADFKYEEPAVDDDEAWENNPLTYADHSHSWLSWDEIIKSPNPCGTVTRTGIVDRETYLKWDGISQPDSWCGGISGPGVRIALGNDITDIPEDITHFQIQWKMPADGLDYFINAVKDCLKEYGEGRIVFGFDS